MPLVTVANLKTANPLLQVQNQAKLISNINLKDQYQTANSSYFDVKKQLFNEDNTKKTGVDFSQFFDFYQKSNANLPINFATDYDWKRFKLDILDLKPLDQEQSFEIYYRLLQDLPNNKVATSDLYKQKVAYSFVPDYSLSNFATFSEEKLKKLRPYSNQEFRFSTKKELTKLIPIEDFENAVNSAKNASEARKVINKYFNLEEIIGEILNNDSFSFVGDNGLKNSRYQIELTKDQILGQDYLAKTGQRGVYKLTFYASFTPSFAKEIGADLTKNAKYHFGIALDLNNIFLDKSITENIKISQFSENDYFSTTNQSQNSSNSVNGWHFLNYYNNQIFATEKEREEFLGSLISKIVKTPILSKVEFGEQLAGLDYSQISKYLKLDVKLDPDLTKLAIDKNKIVAKIAGKIQVKNQKDEVIAEKDFSQNVENLELLAKNDDKFADEIKKTKFEFEPKAEKWITEHQGIPRAEILSLVQSNKFDKLKKVLENTRYYGYRFNEDRLKLMVDNYKLPTAEEFAKSTIIPEKKPEGIVSIWNSSLKNTQEINRFFATLAKKDVEFVAKFWFDLLSQFNLIDKEKTPWPEEYTTKDLFQKLGKINLVDSVKPETNGQTANQNEPNFWLFSINNDYLISNDYLKNSFYLHSNFKNTLSLMKTNTELSANFFVDQIRQLSKTIQPKDFSDNSKAKNNKIKDLTSFLVAFYSLVYSKDQGLFTESLGENFGYKIQFELDETPVLANVDGLGTQKNQLKLKYWYNIGPIDKNGDLISVVHETKKETLTLPVNETNKLLTESVEKLDEIAKSFPTSDQFVFLTREDYTNILKQIQVAVNKHPEGTNVNIDNEIKKLPFSLFFKYNYENYGLYAVKEKKITEETVTKPQSTQPEEIPGIIENWPAELGNQDRYRLSLYVYNKQNPNVRSTAPIRVVIIESPQSLLNTTV
ncbi:P97 family adhesin [Mesomycoplasma dispar]|uniref:P97 family adhesin n=1 Tax=Mesomycoplasma dispar TaxID=86660 RepID=UPI0038B9C4F3